MVDAKALGERTLWVDCDVLQADGGTRTASVTGAWTALALATWRLRRRGAIDKEAAARLDGRRLGRLDRTGTCCSICPTRKTPAPTSI